MIIKLYIQGEQLMLFKDESISLNSSIADVQDITKNTTEYTKAFTVPADDINNPIFKHYYDFTIDDGFDARIKQDGYIELDGIPFKTGKFRLNKVVLKQGKPYSYTINFWGRLVSFKDLFGEDELSDLNLTAYDHAHNSSLVKTGLTSFLLTGDIVYTPFTNAQLYYNSDPSDSTNTPTLRNIAYNGQPVGLHWNEIKPSLKVGRILDAIGVKYGITFSTEFTARPEFENLYMFLSNSTEKAGGGSVIIDWDDGNSPYINHGDDTGTFTTEPLYSGNIDSWTLTTNVTPSVGFETVSYIVKIYVNGELALERPRTTGVDSSIGGFANGTSETKTDEIYWVVESDGDFEFTASVQQIGKIILSTSVDVITTSSSNTITSTFETSLNIPEMKVLDFIKGLSSMFKWVIIPIDDTNIYINTLNDYYAEGQLLDITEYVDYEKVEVSRGKILNPISFKFQEPKTILGIQFQKNQGVFFGNLDATLKDDSGNVLDGEAFKVELPFEQMVYERLSDTNDNSETNIVVGGTFDESISPVVMKPHLHYVSGSAVSSVSENSVGFIDENGVISEITGAINFPTHSHTISDNIISTAWGSEINVHNDNSMLNSLYSTNYETYISNIFNIKRRNVRYKVKNFPLRLLLGLELNDVIQIKSNYYRIDNYDLDLLTGEIDFKLVNSFDNNIGGFYPDRDVVVVDYNIQSENVYVVNGGNMSVVETDLGDGVGWTDITITTNNIQIDFNAERDSRFARTVQLDVTNNDTLQTFSVTAIQTGRVIGSLDMTDEYNTVYYHTITGFI